MKSLFMKNISFLCVILIGASCYFALVNSKSDSKKPVVELEENIPDNLYSSDVVVKLVKPPGAKEKYSGENILMHNANSKQQELKGILQGYKPEQVTINRDKKQKKDSKLRMIKKAQEAMGIGGYNLTELMSMKSSWDSSSKFSNTTIILNHWKRDSLRVQLDAILALTVRPAYIWVCVFDSPQLEMYQNIVEEYQQHFKKGVLTLTQSDFNFKYYGRFQLALQAWTEYVWVIDDDIIPGPKMLGILTHTLNIHNLRAGVLGTIGWVMPPLNEKYRQFDSYRSTAAKGGMYFEDPHYDIRVNDMLAADLICSHWFLRVDHVKLLFRDKWVTYETAEDYMLSYSLRRYANLESYVLPSLENDPSTWGNMDIFQGFSAENATTVGDKIKLRDNIWWSLVQRGGKFHWMKFRNYMRKQPGFFESQNNIDHEHEVKHILLTEDKQRYPPAFSIALFVDGAEDAEALADLHHLLGSVWDTLVSQELLTIITGGVRGMCKDLLTLMPYFTNHEAQFCKGDMFGLFNMNLGLAYDQHFTSTSIFLEMHSILNEMIDALGSGDQMPLFIALEQQEEGLDKTIKSTLREVLDHRDIRLLSLKPHEVIAASSLAMLEPEALAAWRVPVYTLVILHMKPSSEMLSLTLEALDEAYFFGDPIDIVMVVGTDVSEEERDKIHSFQWINGGTKRIKYLHRNLHYSVAAFEAFCPLSPSNNYIIVIETQLQPYPAFYLWTKFLAIEAALETESNPEKFRVCLTERCEAPFHGFTGDSWLFALSACADLLERGNDHCSSVFEKESTIFPKTLTPPFDLVETFSNPDKKQDRHAELRALFGLMPNKIRFEEDKIKSLENEEYVNKMRTSLQRYKSNKRKKYK